MGNADVEVEASTKADSETVKPKRKYTRRQKANSSKMTEHDELIYLRGWRDCISAIFGNKVCG